MNNLATTLKDSRQENGLGYGDEDDDDDKNKHALNAYVLLWAKHCLNASHLILFTMLDTYINTIFLQMRN